MHHLGLMALYVQLISAIAQKGREEEGVPTRTFLLSGSGSLTIREAERDSATEEGRLIVLGEGGIRDVTDALRDGVMMW
jgi:hypothetical protein